ncbi:hypothetical protein ACIPLC_00760 [Kitasatospora sp. NPDC086801]|uniref:hypothetical protein n=1 Tax=Kitasatospora sp. NPDC086801 TaxID=3364066 RepID=UPI0038264130
MGQIREPENVLKLPAITNRPMSGTNEVAQVLNEIAGLNRCDRVIRPEVLPSHSSPKVIAVM